ncbi:DgyrCDS515 [Dimorphilus gyrociliatus]|uniref:DgyrCDS515 n=1 Tax=Dimorphilus gyrociliatus TaxID=2664684 RepID=A0A7I8V6L8_9ANNE|nr:DgyrCDS515 [Dimorphilus gyrociliatus]
MTVEVKFNSLWNVTDPGFILNCNLSDKEVLKTGNDDHFLIFTQETLGALKSVTVNCKSCEKDSWYLCYIRIHDILCNRIFYFPFHGWIIPENGIKTVNIPVCFDETSLHIRRFIRCFLEYHIWLRLFFGKESYLSAFGCIANTLLCLGHTVAALTTSALVYNYRCSSPAFWWSSGSRVIEICFWSFIPWIILVFFEVVLRNVRSKKALLSEYTPAIDLAHLVPSVGVEKRILDGSKQKKFDKKNYDENSLSKSQSKISLKLSQDSLDYSIERFQGDIINEELGENKISLQRSVASQFSENVLFKEVIDINIGNVAAEQVPNFNPYLPISSPKLNKKLLLSFPRASGDADSLDEKNAFSLSHDRLANKISVNCPANELPFRLSNTIYQDKTQINELNQKPIEFINDLSTKIVEDAMKDDMDRDSLEDFEYITKHPISSYLSNRELNLMVKLSIEKALACKSNLKGEFLRKCLNGMEIKDNHFLSGRCTDGFSENVKLNSKSNFHTEQFPDRIAIDSNLEDNQTTIDDQYDQRLSMTNKKLKKNVGSIQTPFNKKRQNTRLAYGIMSRIEKGDQKLVNHLMLFVLREAVEGFQGTIEESLNQKWNSNNIDTNEDNLLKSLIEESNKQIYLSIVKSIPAVVKFLNKSNLRDALRTDDRFNQEYLNTNRNASTKYIDPTRSELSTRTLLTGDEREYLFDKFEKRASKSNKIVNELRRIVGMKPKKTDDEEIMNIYEKYFCNQCPDRERLEEELYRL